MLHTADPTVHGYPPFQGMPELREAIADRYRSDYGVTLDPDTEIAVVPGTKTGIMLVTLACADSGDGVLLPDPATPTTTRPSRSRGRGTWRCRSTARPAGSRASTG